MAVVQLPVAFISAAATTILYLTAFKDEPFGNLSDLLSEGNLNGPLFALVVAAAFEGLFAQVARGATILSVAGLVTGKPRSLSAALDPAFTRMGGLLALAVFFLAMVGISVVTVVGVVIAPYLALRLGLAVEAYMLEDIGPRAALARAWRMMSGNVLRLAGVVALLILILAAPFVSVSLLSLLADGSRTTEVVVGGVVSFVQALLLIPPLAFVSAATTIFYLELKATQNAGTAA